MSRQTDELMYLNQVFGPSQDAQEKAQQALTVKESESRLRLLQDLLRTPGFDVFLEQLKTAKLAAFSEMERAQDSTALAKASGAYCALSRAIDYTTDEVSVLATFLKGSKDS